MNTWISVPLAIVSTAVLSPLFTGLVPSRGHVPSLNSPSSTLQDEQDEQKMTQRDLMRTKLMYSQNIVEGLTTKRFSLILDAAREIKQLTHVQAWNVREGEEYARMSQELRDSTDRLSKAAEEMNVEAATLRYLELTVNCINCHQYMNQNDF